MNRAVARERALLKLTKAIIEVEAEITPLQVKLAKLRAEFSAMARGGSSADPDDDDDDDALDEDGGMVKPALRAPSASRALTGKSASQQRPEWVSLNDRILGYFAANPGEHDVDAIAEGAKGSNRQSLRAALTMLFKEGKLSRVHKGIYAIPSNGRPTLVIATRAGRGHGP
jgi:hypothetical protein